MVSGTDGGRKIICERDFKVLELLGEALAEEDKISTSNWHEQDLQESCRIGAVAGIQSLI